jgi:colanic acid/amylovoran biosynthesis glycosyltransferase
MPDKKPLRLLVVGANWPPETFLGRLLRGLAASGMEVSLALNRDPDQEWFLNSGLRAFRTRSWEGPRLLRLVWLSWLAAQAFVRSPRDFWCYVRQSRSASTLNERLRILNRLLPFAGASFDVLYFPWNSAAIDYFPLLSSGIPAFVSCRGSQVNVAPHDPGRGIGRNLRATFERAVAVHCVSAAIEREAGRLGLETAKARVIYPGVDPDFFCPPSVPGSAPTIGLISVGRLVWVKGTTYALQSLRLLLDRGIAARLTLIGDGPERQRVLYTIEDLGLRDHVDLLGRRSPIAVRDLLQKADVFVLPSLSEGFCNAAIEAMGCGIPVVMANCGGAREGVTDGVEGFIVPPRDSEGMAAAIEKLVLDPGLRARMGQAGRERVLRQFTLVRHVSEFRTLIEEVRGCQVA